MRQIIVDTKIMRVRGENYAKTGEVYTRYNERNRTIEGAREGEDGFGGA